MMTILKAVEDKEASFHGDHANEVVESIILFTALRISIRFRNIS